MRAEIDVPSITSEEAASFKASVAAPAAFTAAGLEYSATMSGLQANLARRPDGRFYLRLTTDKAINDPYIDMILEASWASGRIVRDYTMLFDPPALRQAVAPAPTLPQTTASASASVPAKTGSMPPAEAPARSSKPVAPLASKPAAPAPATDDKGNGQQVRVKPGDSASKIAVRTKSSDVSLDQMLVALLRANPDAFSNGNLNRLRAGAVLDVPSAEQAKSVSTAEASQTVVAQSKDFNAFRRSLADSAPKATVEAADRKATGSVDAKVEDKKSAQAAADKLTLSKGALKAKAEEEAKLAKERAAADAKTRADELAKNIEDLKKLSAASAKAPALGASQSASAPAAPMAPAVAVAPPPAAVASAPASAAAPTPAQPKIAAPASTMAPEAEPSLVDALLEDPILPLAGGGLIALLGALGLYRRSQGKKKAASLDSSFMESSLQPESFVGASGGQQIDTGQASGSSSMGYSNSEMGTPDDVDPVAEADVYLAYGRDAQAEEILKAALPTNPERVAIHTKLLEIYAKRRDTVNFLAAAKTAFTLTGADSAEWAHICELGLSIDPENPLYQPGGANHSAFASSVEGNATAPEPNLDATVQMHAQAPSTDVDLDLDFSADDPAPVVPPAEAPAPEAAPSDPSNGLDFDISGPAALGETPVPAPEPVGGIPNISLSLDDLSLDMPDAPTPPPAPAAAAEVPSLDLPEFSMEIEEPAAAPAVAEAPAKTNEGMLEFDLGSLSLDLDSSTSADPASDGDGSLETKLALAEEFVSIGDNDGARALIEEVVAEATGDLRERAQRALANLS